MRVCLALTRSERTISGAWSSRLVIHNQWSWYQQNALSLLRVHHDEMITMRLYSQSQKVRCEAGRYASSSIAQSRGKQCQLSVYQKQRMGHITCVEIYCYIVSTLITCSLYRMSSSQAFFCNDTHFPVIFRTVVAYQKIYNTDNCTWQAMVAVRCSLRSKATQLFHNITFTEKVCRPGFCD